MTRRLPGKSGRQGELIEAAKDQLGRDAIWVTKGNHYAIRLPDGKKIVISGTPSDRRTFYNDRARLRRAGIEI